MSRRALLGLSLASGLVLAACGGGDAPNNSPAPTPVAPTEAVSNDGAETPAPTPAPPPTPKGPAPEFANLPEPYASADYARGKRTFKLCQSCHTLTEGGPNLVGPNLYGMFDRQVGGADGFGYSKAVQDADFVWTPERLDDWLANPRDFLPGNAMSFAGVRREADRLGVVAYIMAETNYTDEAPQIGQNRLATAMTQAVS